MTTDRPGALVVASAYRPRRRKRGTGYRMPGAGCRATALALSPLRRPVLVLLIVSLSLAFSFISLHADTVPTQPIRFRVVDIYLDTGDAPLAAYQVELVDPSGLAQVVGVEGGRHEAYREPPYYDPEALSRNRIILGAFSTARNLPKGKVLVARVHVQITGAQPDFSLKLHTAASADGEKISPKAGIMLGGKS